MPLLHLTQRAVDNLPAPDPSGRQTIYWDDAMAGFGVLVSGTTSAKTYKVQGIVDGRKVRRTIRSDAGVMTLEQAKRKARETLGGFVGGVDPRAVRNSKVTLRAAMDAYLAARNGNLRLRSAAGYKVEMERHLKEWLDRPLRDITREMVEARHKNISEEIHESRGMPGRATANRVLKNFCATWAFMADRVPSLPPNPVKLKKMWHKVRPRERHLRGADFAKFYQAAIGLPNGVGRDYALTLMFTGLRRNEAAKIRWKDVDFEGRTLTIPAEHAKNGRKLVLPLTDVLHELLKARRAIGDTDWVFVSTSKSGHLVEPKSFFRDIAAKTGVRVSPHDMRRSFLTVGEVCGVRPMALAALVNHTLPGVTPSYVQLRVEDLREPAQQIADALKRLCGAAT